MNLQQLITFSTVVSEGSMTAAAEKLFLTQPAVSQQIRNLEDELGVGLLDRGARHARPTVQGQLLYDYARRIIQLTQQAQAAIQTMAEGVQGHLRIGTLNSLGLQLVAPSVATLLKHHNRVSIQLFYEEAQDVLKGIAEGRLDVAILPEIPEDDVDRLGLLGRPLHKDEMWLVASGKDPSLPEEIRFDQIDQRSYVRLTERFEGFDQTFRDAHARTGVRLATVFESNNVGTLKRVIESGLGWGFLPAHAVRKQVRMGRLSRIEVTDLRHTTNVVFYSRNPSEVSQLVDVFFRVLKQGIGA
ncbi:MAG: LysR family transcriptional regulator [Bdellovibrionales bacterium]|jgi:DNA-binding transcriptional LysR family regulator|nr:LysR family transcriptional regulator [Bdellovibrionales bacterium]